MLRNTRIHSAAAVLFLAAICSVVAAPVRHSPDEVLLVYNSNSPVSTAVAKDYAAKRGVTHLLTIACIDSAANSDNETIPLADYQKEIAGPVGSYLARHDGINFIVLTKGVPLRIIVVGDPLCCPYAGDRAVMHDPDGR